MYYIHNRFLFITVGYGNRMTYEPREKISNQWCRTLKKVLESNGNTTVSSKCWQSMLNKQ